MKQLDIARARVRTLTKQEASAFVAGAGLLVVGGLLSVPALMFAGLVLLAIGRRVLVAPAGSDRTSDPKATPLAVRALAAAAVVTVLAIFASFFSNGSAVLTKRRWTFVDDSFATTETWSIEHHAAATGGRALSKGNGEAGSSPLLVVTTASARDVRAMTRCKGDACGLAFRIADVRTHSVARVVSNRVELVRVEDGLESLVASSPLSAGGVDVWQELGIEARGDFVRITVNGIPAIEHHDPRPAIAGGVGLWAPARAWFDELSIETLAASPQSIEVLPFLRRPS
jgi:hypothetical protein